MKIFRIDKNDIKPKKFETHIIGSDNKVKRVLAGNEAYREYVTYDKLPPNLIKAIITAEDQRFFRHHGIDAKSLMRSIIVDIVTFGKFVQGGSTITQQLIKNTMFPDWYTNNSLVSKLKRKFGEIIYSLKLEKLVSKEEILESYLNVIYFGNGRYGVQTASKYYFNKNVWELSLIECAILAGIPLSPSEYNPFSNKRKCMSRCKVILYKMHVQKKITPREYSSVSSGRIKSEILRMKPSRDFSNKVFSYYEDALISQVVNNLKIKKDITEERAVQIIYNSGLKINSSEDEKIQSFCESLYMNPDFIPELSKKDGPQSAMILMDSCTGQVKATVGGRGKKKASLVFNRATDAARTNNLEMFEMYFDRFQNDNKHQNKISIIDVCLAYMYYESKGDIKKAAFYNKVCDRNNKTLLAEGEAFSDSEKMYNESMNRHIHEVYASLPSYMDFNYMEDVWVVGKVGKYVLGVWGGYDDYRKFPLKEEYYTYTKRIWREIANYIEREYHNENTTKA